MYRGVIFYYSILAELLHVTADTGVGMADKVDDPLTARSDASSIASSSFAGYSER